MSNLIENPFTIFTDKDGSPLEDGYIYIGQPGLNPLSNPMDAFWDANRTIPALQVRTKGGYPWNQGSPGRLYTRTNYSILVQNKKGVTVYLHYNSLDYSNTFTDAMNTCENLACLRQLIPDVANTQISVAGETTPGDGGIQPLYYWDEDSIEADNGSSVIKPTSVSGAGRWKWTDNYISARIELRSIINSIEYGKQIGEYVYLNKYKAPSALDEENPGAYFPAFCLNTIDGYEDISEANWPLFVDPLRELMLTYMEGTASEVSDFPVTDWDITSDVATLTFDSTDAADAILEGLHEDYMYGGVHRAITLPSDIGDIVAGEYQITDIDVSTNTLTFDYVADDNSGTDTWTANFYSNRVIGSTTTARLYQATGDALTSANSSEGNYICGLRMRDAEQRITGTITKINSVSNAGPLDSASNNIDGVFSNGTDQTNGPGINTTRTGAALIFDSANSTSPNQAKTNDEETHVKSQVGHLYIWGRRYIA